MAPPFEVIKVSQKNLTMKLQGDYTMHKLSLGSLRSIHLSESVSERALIARAEGQKISFYGDFYTKLRLSVSSALSRCVYLGK